MIQDFLYVIQWHAVSFFIGIIFFPITYFFLNKFEDHGYAFSKVIGIIILSYIVFTLGILKIAPFTILTILGVLIFSAMLNFLISKKYIERKIFTKKFLFLAASEELLFLVALTFWSWIKSYQPDIHGLEKYMDFGFINSALRATFFPPKDMWYAPHFINYYYFGHLTTAVLTKLSLLPSFITYNLMVATLFAWTFILPFSFLITLIKKLDKKAKKIALLGAIVAGLLLSLGGNLHIVYSLFHPYQTEKPQPPWQLTFAPNTFPNNYWYPNATRFIPYTIHEFPIYSFVVSDLHGHVLDIPFVLTSLALAYAIFSKSQLSSSHIIFFSFLLSVMYTTNALDGPIYMLLASFIIFLKNIHLLKLELKSKKNIISKKLKNLTPFILQNIKYFLLLIIGFIIFSLPFNTNFKPFVSGIGVMCAPNFLTELESKTKDGTITKGRLGPFLFEKDHCQHSQAYQLLILHGFYLFFIISYMIFLMKKNNEEIYTEDKFIGLLIILSLILIIAPEFIYAKDIYPSHFRANTMFKLGYQAFIMLGLASAFIFIRILKSKSKKIFDFSFIFFILATIQIASVLYYSNFAISSYFEQLKNYKGLNGINYLQNIHPEDHDAIIWITKNIKNQPILLEAQGDSYTDYERISSNTGLPTIAGWTVHEWLWRGTYEAIASRIEEVKIIYESVDIKKTKELLKKYDVEYVYIGDLEREKYPNLNEEKFEKLGKIVFQSANTKIYKISTTI